MTETTRSIFGVPWWVPAFAAGVRLAVILVGFASVLIFGLPRGAPTSRDHDLLSLQSRWDAGWYVGIASGGYRVGPDGHFTNAAFFPAFPAVLRMTATLFRVPRTPETWAWTGAIVACVLFVVAMCYLYLFASERAGARPEAAVILCSLYPVAFFFGACYSESLFLLSCLGSYTHLLKRQYLPATVWGIVAGLTRPIGWLLAVPLAYELIRRRHALRPRELLAAASPVIGLLLFCGYLFAMTGNPLEWLAAQSRWGRHVQGPLAVVQDLTARIQEHGLAGFAATWPGDVLNALAAVFALAAVVPIWRRYGAGDALFVAVAVGAPLIFGGLTSVARFTSVLFPIFVWLSAAVGPARWRTGLWVLFAAGEAIAAAMFYAWRPLF